MNKTYLEKSATIKKGIAECDAMLNDGTYSMISDTTNTCLLKKISYELELIILQNESNMNQQESQKPHKH